MELTIDEARHVARLARLALSDEQLERLRADLAQILEFAAQVGEVAGEHVEPTSHALGLVNVARADEPHTSLPQDQALAGAPRTEDGRFRVPAILGEPE